MTLRPIDRGSASGLVSGLSARMVGLDTAPHVFTAAECAQICALREQLGFDEARVESRADPSQREAVAAIRSTERTHVLCTPTTQWIYDRIASVAETANTRSWQFRMSHIEPLQLLTYPVGGHYDWHADLGTTGIMALRKLSITVQLTPPGDYTGGDLEIRVGSRVVHGDRALGAAVLFPSWQSHRVAPVSAGCRQALVAWVVGKRPLR